jgi:hypothetical protein
VEYPGLQMVKPDDRVEVLLHHGVPFIGQLNGDLQLIVLRPGNDL